MNVTVMFDGGARGNPGPGYGSYRITREEIGRSITETVEFDLGAVTNNEAEYLTLIQALHRIPARHRPEIAVTLVGDSQLVLKQVSGEYAVNAETLRHLHGAVTRLLGDFAAHQTRWVPRSEIVKEFGH